MPHSQEKIRYFIYARKSSESDEKQVQSIEDQTMVLEAYRKAHNLDVVDIFTEAQSAKEPNSRPVFEKMLKRIKSNEANGILVWKIDRLSRNPIDGATIQWLLQKQIIRSIKTPDREYCPEDNVLILSVESSMATQYILDLSKNVKRGLKSKIDKGWRPSIAPLGYLNTKTELRGENYIIKDPERFNIIRKAWQLMLTGSYRPTEILNIVNNDWGLCTRQTKRRGGKALSRATIYRIFSNIFYAGIIDTNGLYAQGKHDPMITVEEYDRVQLLLGRKGKPRPSRHEYAYTGIIRCGECHGVISATNKQKFINKTNTVKEYTLYYCVCARKKTNNCQQLRYLNSELIDAAIEEVIISFTIHPKFKELIFKIFDEIEGRQREDKNDIIQMQQDTLDKMNKQLTNLTQLRLRDMLDDQEYMTEKQRLKNEMVLLESKLLSEKATNKNHIDLTREVFSFAIFALKAFKTDSLKVRGQILKTICGLNCTLKDKTLNISKPKWLIALQNGYKTIEVKYQEFELENTLSEQGQNRFIEPLCLELRGLIDDVGTKLLEERNETPIVHMDDYIQLQETG